MSRACTGSTQRSYFPPGPQRRCPSAAYRTPSRTQLVRDSARNDTSVGMPVSGRPQVWLVSCRQPPFPCAPASVLQVLRVAAARPSCPRRVCDRATQGFGYTVFQHKHLRLDLRNLFIPPSLRTCVRCGIYMFVTVPSQATDRIQCLRVGLSKHEILVPRKPR